MAASACLICLEKLYKKIYSKEYCFVKQSLCELETEEAVVAKTGFNLTVVETVDTLVVESLSLIAYLLSLTDFFFNSSFSQLPDLLFYNTP